MIARQRYKRRNVFLRTLRDQTLAYIEAEKGEAKKQLRQILVNTKAEFKKTLKYPIYAFKKQGVVRYYHKGKEVKEGDSRFGKVYTDTYKLVPNVSNAAMMAANEYMQRIFDKSQELVPIDKRYNAINIKDKNTVRVKSYRRRPIIDISGAKDFFGELAFSARDEKTKYGFANFRRYFDYEDEAANEIQNLIKSSKTTAKIDMFSRNIEVGYGWYSGTAGAFIKKYLSGTNTRGQFNLYYDRDTGLIMERTGRGSYEFTPATGISLKMKGKTDVDPKKIISVAKQPSFGYQELKKGGKLNQSGLMSTIEYNAFDETKPKGDRYNYAALQHDNLAFKHKFGQSLYLSDAVMMYRKQMLKAVKKASVEAFDRGK